MLMRNGILPHSDKHCGGAGKGEIRSYVRDIQCFMGMKQVFHGLETGVSWA